MFISECCILVVIGHIDKSLFYVYVSHFPVCSAVYFFFRASAQVREEELPKLMEVVGNYSVDRVHSMRRQIRFLYRNYFDSMAKITLTTLDVINSRVFPYAARSYHEWNEPPDVVSNMAGWLVCVLPYMSGCSE